VDLERELAQWSGRLGAIAVVVTILIVTTTGYASGWGTDAPVRPAAARQVAWSLLPTPTPSPTLTPTPSPTPRPTVTPRFSPTPTDTPLPTATATPLPPTATATPLPTRPPGQTPTPAIEVITATQNAEGHYWLDRPLPASASVSPSRYYPYGTTAKGQYLLHHGVDTVNPAGTPILAVADGVVVVAGDDLETVWGLGKDFYGNLVVIRLDRTYKDQPVFCLYGHLESVSVTEGQRVRAGDVMGGVGGTGIARGGMHLHFEVRVGENTYASTRNPALWLKPLEGRGTLVGRVVDAQGRLVPEQQLVLRKAGGGTPITIYTYLDHGVNPDDDWGENFVVWDLDQGAYDLEIRVNKRAYSKFLVVREGQTTWVNIRLE